MDETIVAKLNAGRAIGSFYNAYLTSEIIFVQQLKVFVGLVFKHCQKLIYISVFCLGKGFHNEFERLMNQLISFYCIV